MKSVKKVKCLIEVGRGANQLELLTSDKADIII